MYHQKNVNITMFLHAHRFRSLFGPFKFEWYIFCILVHRFRSSWLLQSALSITKDKQRDIKQHFSEDVFVKKFKNEVKKLDKSDNYRDN
jgi:hypothetical protein